MWHCLHNPTFSHFSITLTCDGQIDRHGAWHIPCQHSVTWSKLDSAWFVEIYGSFLCLANTLFSAAVFVHHLLLVVSLSLAYWLVVYCCLLLLPQCIYYSMHVCLRHVISTSLQICFAASVELSFNAIIQITVEMGRTLTFAFWLSFVLQEQWFKS